MKLYIKGFIKTLAENNMKLSKEDNHTTVYRYNTED